jgi:hypothetical protein
MKLSLYYAIKWIGAPFRYHVIGLENIRDGGPAIFTCNHLVSIGPLQMVLSLPVRFYPWVIGEMCDYERGPQYLYDDFIHKSWNVSGKLGMGISTAVSHLAVSLFKRLKFVSVDRNRGRNKDAFRRSLELLGAGENLLIFPEEPKASLNPETQMRPFLYGYIGLCRIYQRQWEKTLPVYPVAVYSETRTLTIGMAIYYENLVNRRQDIYRTGKKVEDEVIRLYLEMKNGPRTI